MAKKKYTGFRDQGIVFRVNFDPIIDGLAAGQALSESLEDKRYVDAIVDEAFDKADDVFNSYAAAYALTGAISHMYEWGTVGVNRGRSNLRLSPNHPSARLWQNFNEGAGLDRVLWYSFRPSVANVPKPTKAATGMSTDVINKMRDHVFWNKAMVMEEGHEVTISPKRAKWLLIPAYESNRPFMRPQDVKRGYMLTKGPITISENSNKFAGSFTAFWVNFWEGRGNEILTEDMYSQVQTDYKPEFRPRRNAGSLRPVGTVAIAPEVKSRAKKTKARVLRKAQARKTR